jgi:hypothetical protein
MATIKKKMQAGGVSKKSPKAPMVDPNGAWTKVQERTLGNMKKGGTIKKAQGGTKFGKYNIDTTGYSEGKKVFPYTAPNPRILKSQPATRTGKMGRADVEKVMKSTSKAKDGKWIQKAINPKHKGYCTPETKATCTPRRKALAHTLRKMAKKK